MPQYPDCYKKNKRKEKKMEKEKKIPPKTKNAGGTAGQ